MEFLLPVGVVQVRRPASRKREMLRPPLLRGAAGVPGRTIAGAEGRGAVGRANERAGDVDRLGDRLKLGLIRGLLVDRPTGRLIEGDRLKEREEPPLERDDIAGRLGADRLGALNERELPDRPARSLACTSAAGPRISSRASPVRATAGGRHDRMATILPYRG